MYAADDSGHLLPNPNTNHHGNPDANIVANTDCDRHADADQDVDANAYSHQHTLMALGDMQAGPRFANLLTPQASGGVQPPQPGEDVGMGMNPPQTPMMQAVMEANLTNPVHAAKAAAELSKKRLLTMAQQIKQARNAL